MNNYDDMGERGKGLNDVENESKFIGDKSEGGAVGDERDSLLEKSSKRRKYNANQVQELLAAFNDNLRPEENAIIKLGKKLAMDKNQVKFWFQNKRSQVKMRLESHEAKILKLENEKLRKEKIELEEVMRNPTCKRCDGQAFISNISVDEYQTKMKNKRLKEELERIMIVAKNILGPSASLEG